MTDVACVRRWRKASPHCAGWWEWREGGTGPVEKLLLVDGGKLVASDDEWEQATGKMAEYDGWVENYWESTDTSKMGGYWMKTR